jgi:hypothetical protein
MPWRIANSSTLSLALPNLLRLGRFSKVENVAALPAPDDKASIVPVT